MTSYRPQLARLVKAAPEGDEWLHEMKYDGYRIGCRIRGSSVTLTTRNGQNWTAAFPEIVEAAAALEDRDALLDGEVAVVLPDGRTSFQALQNATGGGHRRGLTYFVFDLLRADGRSLTRLPLEERKAALKKLLAGRKGSARGARKILQYSEHVAGRGPEVFAEACRLGLEGIISKRRDAPYKPGRADSWLKTKCVLRQEFVIGGFTEPEGKRQGIGALLIGWYDDGGPLVFAGKVGTGFSVAQARSLRAALEKIETRECPFSPAPAPSVARHARWVKPRLVGEVAFTEWTGDGKIRHPSFQGLRRDKPARDVVRERPAELPRVPKRFAVARPGAAKTASRTSSKPAAGSASAGKDKPPRSQRGAGPVVAGVRISHPDRVLYPDEGLTKLDIARYYERIGERMLPHIEGRALTLVRCPDGVGTSCFYMKHSKVWAPSGIRRVKIQEKTKVGEYLVADTVPALVGLAQMGILEIHTWNSRVDDVERPDRLVLDVDPGKRVEWREVIEAARAIKELLEEAGLESFPKTTGGRGLHVVVPLKPSAGWEECLEFARGLAMELERRDPDRYTTTFAKAGREDKMLIDYLRNNRTNTSVAAFSTRARPGAPVSTPLRWRDLKPSVPPSSFTVLTIEGWLSRRGDPWQDYWRVRQTLPKKAPWRVRATA